MLFFCCSPTPSFNDFPFFTGSANNLILCTQHVSESNSSQFRLSAEITSFLRGLSFFRQRSSTVPFKRLPTKHHKWRLLNSFSGKSQWFNNVMWFALLSPNTTHIFFIFLYCDTMLAQSFSLDISSVIEKNIFSLLFFSFALTLLQLFSSLFFISFFLLRNLSISGCDIFNGLID